MYLNLGALGPKRVQFGAEGDSPSDPATPIDNAGTWLDFTDLVFIDPVGTGFSCSHIPEKEAKKKFYAAEADIEYLSRIIFDWLVKNERLMSRKYIVGESYGGFRGPRITYFLQTQLGVAMKGMVLVSPYLEPAAVRQRRSFAAPVDADAAEHQPPPISSGRASSPTRRCADVVNVHARRVRRRSAAGALRSASRRAHRRSASPQLSGLDPAFVALFGGRLETQAYLREVFRAEGKLGSRYDSNVTQLGSVPVRARPAHERSDARLHHRADDHGDGRLHHPHRRLEVRRPLQRAELRRERAVGCGWARTERRRSR